MFNSYSLSQKVILITGASTGIGAALAETIATKYPDTKLVLVARNQTQLEAVAHKCRQQGATVLVIPIDLAQTEQIQALVQQTIAHFGTVHLLINNAGYGQMGPIELIPLKQRKNNLQLIFTLH